MAKKRLVVIPPNLIKKKAEGLTLVTPLRQILSNMVIDTPGDYARADAVLGRIFQAKALWMTKMAPIVTPLQAAIDSAKLTLKKAKEAMEGADALNEEVLGPLREVEDDCRSLMSDYKLREARQLRETEDALASERKRLAAEIEKTAQQELAATTKPAIKKLEERRQSLVRQAVEVEVEQAQMEAPAKGVNSQSRNVKSWTCTDMDAVVRGCVDGSIPSDVLVLDAGKMLEYFREPITRAQMEAGQWPGIEVKDDVVIAKQGVRGAK